MRSRLIYDWEGFEVGATMFSKIFIWKDRAKSLMLYESGTRAYFYYAEQVRENVALLCRSLSVARVGDGQN